MIEKSKKHPIKIYLCDDQKEHLQQICNTFANLAKEYPTQITSFLSAHDLLEQLKKEKHEKQTLPELVLLDIEMPQTDGISLGKQIKQLFPELFLVFVTAYVEYAVAGYEAAAFRYLLKPVTKESLFKLLADFEKEQNKKKKLRIKATNGEYLLAVQDIVYISAEDKYTVIYTTNKHYVSDCSLKKYEEQLEPYGFFRIHRKYLTNMYHHKVIDGSSVILTGEISLPISKKKREAYRSRLFSSLKEEVI